MALYFRLEFCSTYVHVAPASWYLHHLVLEIGYCLTSAQANTATKRYAQNIEF